MSICDALAAKVRAKKAERIGRNLALAAEENAQLGLPEPFRLNGIWLVPLGAGSYFATLWLLGFRLRDFKHRAAE